MFIVVLPWGWLCVPITQAIPCREHCVYASCSLQFAYDIILNHIYFVSRRLATVYASPVPSYDYWTS